MCVQERSRKTDKNTFSNPATKVTVNPNQYNKISICLEGFGGVCLLNILARNSGRLNPFRLSIILQMSHVVDYINSKGYLVRNFHAGNFFIAPNGPTLKFANLADVAKKGFKQRQADNLQFAKNRLESNFASVNHGSIS